MKLYYAETLNPRKACAVARHLKAPVEYVFVDLAKGEHRTPAFRALNPNQKVPVLVEGGRSLWESNAIMCRLAAAMDSDMWPRDERQIEVIRWLSWDAVHFTRHGGALFFEYVIKPRFGLGGPDPAIVEQALAQFRTFAPVLDAHLSDRRWLVGDGLTVADFVVAVALPYAEDAPIPLEEFANLRRWHDHLNELEAWRAPFPTRQAAG